MRQCHKLLMYGKLQQTEHLHECMVFPPKISTRHPQAFFSSTGGDGHLPFFRCLSQNSGYIPSSHIESSNWKFLKNELPSGTPVEIADPQSGLIDGRVHGIGFFESEKDRIAVFHTVRRQFHTKPTIDSAYWKGKITAAYEQRVDLGLLHSGNTAYRLLHGAKDGIPGLTADIFGNTCKISVTQDGPLFGALHALYGFLSAQGVEKFWIQYAKQLRQAFFGNELINPVFSENGVQFCFLEQKQPTIQEIFTFNNQLRGVRALLQTTALNRDVLQIFAGEGHSTLAAMHGKPRSVLALESRQAKINRLQMLKNLDNKSILTHTQCENMLKHIADIDSEGFHVVDLSIPHNVNDLLSPGKDETPVVKSTNFNEYVYHAMRCCAPDSYLLASGESRPSNITTWAATLLNAVQRASTRLLRPVQLIRTIYAGQDFPLGAQVLSSADGIHSDRRSAIVGFLFKVR